MAEPALAVGVLALQGDVREHESVFAELGIATRRVRRPEDLEGVAGVVFPGGESTTLSLLLGSSGLFEPLRERIAEGLPVFGTCAGIILLARHVEGGRSDQRSFGVLDCTVRRNGYGPQRFSFESDVAPTSPELGGEDGAPLPAVFIRAPLVLGVGGGVSVLAREASDGGAPVVLRDRQVLGATFHPELTADRRVHSLFAEIVGAEGRGGRRW